ncbi:MAG TPA: sensor histidine kinase [Propionibacteriaceae bacterium]|nr:sensor histidine kinase [Propionibacteriaceae bacterium]
MAAVLPLLPERHKAAPRPALLWALGVAAVASCVVTAGLASGNDELYQPALRVLLVWWITLPYIFAGIVAWRRRPDSFFGPLMILAGFVTQLSILQWTSQPLLNTVGQLFDLLVAAVWLHVFLAYPSGRLAGRAERVVVIIGYVAAVGLQAVILMLGGFNDLHLLTVVKREAAAEAIQNVQLLTLSALAVIGVGLLWWRWQLLPRWQRRRPAQILINCFSLSLVMLAALLIAGAFQLPGFEIIRLATFAVAGLAPLAFLAGLLDARLAQAGVGELFVQLRTDPAPDLRELLAQALRDPTLSLIYWLPQYGSWADQDGNPTTLPEPNSSRRVTLVKQNGEQIAALVYDATLVEEPELVEAVSAAAGIALENGRLEAELRARLQELHGSRGRVVEAQQNERRRLERNLHDGAQQRLVALALELGLLAEQADSDPATKTRLKRARTEVAQSLDELRDIARGLHPAVVSGHGLAVALESLVATAPLDVQLETDGLPRLSEPLEVAAYYVVSESLTNAAKHAAATHVRVEVGVSEDALIVEIVDDGVGGADSERGTGLRGLADRVEALDGNLRIWSAVGKGTRVRAELPCG